MPRMDRSTAQRRAWRRASLYVRLSKAAGDENTSRQGMTDDVRALCRDLGLDEVALHVDDGRSGGYRDRPEFRAWVADAKEGRADVLIAWHVDRMTREGINVAAILLDVVEGKDPETGRVAFPPVRLVDTRGLDSEDGDSFRWRFVIAAEVARAERERIRDRARAKDERLRRAGRWPGGLPPYGYRVVDNPDGAGKVLRPDPAQAAVVRVAADKVLQGVPLRRIVADLNSRGVPSRQGTVWGARSLRVILTGDAALGRMVVHGEVLRDDEGHAVEVFPPILTLAQSLALRDALATEGAAHPGRHPARLLSGLLACHECGARLQVGRRAERGQVATYRCVTKAAGGVCAEPVVVSAPGIEAWAERFFLSRWGRLPETERRLPTTPAADVAALDDAIAATVASLAKAATPETFARLQDLQAKRAELAADRPVVEVEDVLTGRTWADAWAAGDVDFRRGALERVLGGPLTLGPGRRGPKGFDAGRLLDLDLDALPDPEGLV